MSGHLEQVYRAYLDALNSRRLGDLDQFVHDRLVYNDESISREQYAQLIAEDVQNIPDLHFAIDLCVTGDDVVACRLWFDCTPEHEFAGIAPTGRRWRSPSTSSTASGTGASSSVVPDRHRRRPDQMTSDPGSSR